MTNFGAGRVGYVNNNNNGFNFNNINNNGCSVGIVRLLGWDNSFS